MTGQQTLIARAALGVFAGAASVVACSSLALRRLSNSRFDRMAILAFIVTRLGLFGLIFFVLHIPPRGDIPAYYWPEANSVLHGLLPYRDFTSSYAPLHAYLDAAVISVWHSPLAIIFLAILAEMALIPLWLRFGRSMLSESELRTATLLYLFSTISLQFVSIDGQDNVIIAVLLALSLLLLAHKKELLSGFSTGVATAAIKFLPLLFVPAFFLALRRRWRWTLGIALPILAVYGSFAAMHLPILAPLQGEGNIKTAGNLPYLVESLLGVTLPSRLWDLLVLAVLAAILLLVQRVAQGAASAVRLRALVFALSALPLALLLFSKKSWPPYLMLCLFPICLLMDTRRPLPLACFALASLAGVVEHSYWSTFVHQISAQELHGALLSGQPDALLLLALEIALLAGYAWLLTLSLQRIRSAQDWTDRCLEAEHPLPETSLRG